ncbi:MAG: universal stress protein [Thermoleophilia bacterium]|nr:universal stress protein [Thermoleophilia bacterium]
MLDHERIRLLIGHDGNSTSDTAIATAAALFPGSRAAVLHVSKSFADWGVGSRVWMLDRDLYDVAVLDAAQRQLDAAVEAARTAGLDDALGELLTTGGSVWRTMLTAAAEFEPDVVVVGKHAHGSRGSVRLGSVAHGLVARCPFPVLVVHPRDDGTSPLQPGGPVVIAYDGSEGARRMVDIVARLLPGAPTRIVSVWEPIPVWVVAPPMGPATFHADFDTELQQLTQERADEGVARAQAAGLDAEAIASEAPDGAWRAIIRIASERSARVLCIGARSRGRVAAALLGGVAHAVVAESPVPVLIAHPDPVSDADGT